MKELNSLKEWYTYINTTKKPYRKKSNDRFYLEHTGKKYILTKVGTGVVVETSSRNEVFGYLFKNYLYKKTGVYVYFSDPIVYQAMEKGIRKNGKRLNPYPTISRAQRSLYKGIKMRYTQYYFGFEVKNKEDRQLVLNKIMEHDLTMRCNCGFTSDVKKKMITPEMIKNFSLDYDIQNYLAKTSNLGALMGCKSDREYKNVQSWDMASAYIYHFLTHKFPSNNFFFIKDYRSIDHKKYACYLKLRVNLTIKTEFARHSIFPMPKSATYSDKSIVSGNGKFLKAVDAIIDIWDIDLAYIRYFYTGTIEFISGIAFELKDIPTSVHDYINGLYTTKETKKSEKLDYSTEKLILNRATYGLFVTKNANGMPADFKVPFQIGSYIVALQRYTLVSHIKSIGFDNIIGFHTDSIKTTIDATNHFCMTNSMKAIGGKLGGFEHEFTAKRILFFNVVRYKADTDKGLIVKHGGIEKEDMVIIFGMNYDDVNANTEIIQRLKYMECIDDNGSRVIIYRTITFGKMTEDMNCGWGKRWL